MLKVRIIYKIINQTKSSGIFMVKLYVTPFLYLYICFLKLNEQRNINRGKNKLKQTQKFLNKGWFSLQSQTWKVTSMTGFWRQVRLLYYWRLSGISSYCDFLGKFLLQNLKSFQLAFRNNVFFFFFFYEQMYVLKPL